MKLIKAWELFWLLVGFTLLYCHPSFAGNGSGNVSNVYGLGVAVNSPSSPISFAAMPAGAQVFTLFAGDWVAAGTIGNYYPFYKNGVAYQVTSGKTAYCFDLNALQGSAAYFQLMSATASFAFNAASVTGGVYQMGVSGKYGNAILTSSVYVAIPGTYQFNSLTFPGIQFGAAAVIVARLDCYEN